MWSGPRNISTAMMRAWGNRPDTFVCDEPLYAHYLRATGLAHPGADEVIARHEPDWRKVVAWLTQARPEGKAIFYQKQMTHHMIEGFDRSWVAGLTNAFLIRSPERVLASYARKWSDVTLRAIGFIEQAEIFDLIGGRLGQAPPVIDAEDILSDPRGMLEKLCAALSIRFEEAMLAWPKGPKPFDGVWAPHWYNAVWQSTGFEKPRDEPIELPDELRRIADAARPFYERLWKYRI